MGKEIAVRGLIITSFYMLFLTIMLISISSAKAESINSGYYLQGDDISIIYQESKSSLKADIDYNESFFDSEDKLSDISAKTSTSTVKELWNTVRVSNVQVQSESEGFNTIWVFMKLLFIWFPSVLFAICLIYSLPFF